MDRFKKFGEQLLRTDPAAADFVQSVDELVEAVPDAEKDVGLIEPIFAFFEAHPLDDMGAPELLYIY